MKSKIKIPVRPRHERSRKTSKKPRYWALGLLLFGAILVIAFIIDAQTFEKRRDRLIPTPTADIQNIILNRDIAPYRDPDGYFTMIPPAGWKVEVKSPDTGYNAAFLGPNGVSISVTVDPVEYNSFKTLLRRVHDVERKMGINMNIHTNTFLGMPAVYRDTQLHHAQLVTIDFVTNNVAHEIQISMPNAFAKAYKPVLMDVIESYRPLPVDGLSRLFKNRD